MKIDLIEIANGAEIPDMRLVVQELAVAVVNLQRDQNVAVREAEKRAFRGDASLASLFSVALVTALNKGGYKTVDQVMLATDDELLAVPKLGQKSVDEIRKALP